MKMPKLGKVKPAHILVGATALGLGVWFFFLRKKTAGDHVVIDPGSGDPVTPPGNPPNPPYVPGGNDFTMAIDPVITPVGTTVYVDMYPAMSIDPLEVETLEIVYPVVIPGGEFVYNTFTVPYLTPQMRNPSPGSIPVIENWFARVIIPSGDWIVTVIAYTFDGRVSNAVSIPVSM